MIKREFSDLAKYCHKQKVLIIYGARRVGKTTLVNYYLSHYKGKYKRVSGDDIIIQEVLSSSNISTISDFCQGYDLLVIDEAQNIPNMRHGLKILADYIPSIQVIATGSSSFEIANKVSEPLVGHKKFLTLYPISQQELASDLNKFELKQKVEEYIIYGSYPEV
jgi:predicted AAA+ superfamily ATPase